MPLPDRGRRARTDAKAAAAVLQEADGSPEEETARHLHRPGKEPAADKNIIDDDAAR